MPVDVPLVYRFRCPHCQKLIKTRIDDARLRGICPHCKEQVEFTPYRAPPANSATAQQLLKQLAPDDAPVSDERDFERLALLLSQGTCHDYHLADQLLNHRSLAARQWRRVLNAADIQESTRLRVQDLIDKNASATESLLPDADTLTQNAWQILARLLYYQRHGTCEACKQNPTGLACAYLTFESFLAAHQIAPARAANWRTLLQHHLGV